MTSRPRLTDLALHASPVARLTFDHAGSEISWTHVELLARASRLAMEIRTPESGDTNGQRAAIVVDGTPSGAWVVAALAAMLADRPLVAFPETVPAEGALDALPSIPVHQIFTDDATRWPGLTCVPLSPLVEESEPGTPHQQSGALRFDVIAYTSGTTEAAQVKRFRMGPESSEVFAEEFVRRFQLRPGDTWAICHSFSHIVHFEYVLACLSYGIDARIIAASDLPHRMGRVSPSAVVTVPAVYEQLVRALENRVRRSPVQHWIWRSASRLPARALWTQLVRRFLRLTLTHVRAGTGGNLKVLILGAASSTPTLKRRLASLGLPVYEGYGMTELGMVACQSPGDVRMGTVGRPWPGLDVHVDSDGVLVVRPRVPRTSGYLDLASGDDPLFDSTGAVTTGDLATREADGHIRITGRKKALIISDRGKNVNPSVVEGRLGRLPQVLVAVPFGDGRPYLTAVVFLHAGAPEVTMADLDAANVGAPQHERVHGLVQVRMAPSTVDGLLTRSGKVRPAAVLERYASDLDALYHR